MSVLLPPVFLARVAATLLLAWLAAQLCLVLHTPLPWMLGPLISVSLLSIGGAPTQSWARLRDLGQWTIGGALGLYFTPAVTELVAGGEVEVVYPVHLNPLVKDVVQQRLGHVAGVHLIAPQDYVGFVRLMQRAFFVLTDSGGVQEEAPALGKPVLLLRDVTERPSVVEAGVVKLVGTDRQRIVSAANALLHDGAAYQRMTQATHPYGHGDASEQIVKILLAAKAV